MPLHNKYWIMKKYDYLIVGSGLFGATFAYKANQVGRKCLVIDKRHQLGGNVYCENIEGINVQRTSFTRQTRKYGTLLIPL